MVELVVAVVVNVGMCLFLLRLGVEIEFLRGHLNLLSCRVKCER